MKLNIPLAGKLTKHERKWRERNWTRFSLTVPGRLSWADWFQMRRHARKCSGRIVQIAGDE